MHQVLPTHAMHRSKINSPPSLDPTRNARRHAIAAEAGKLKLASIRLSFSSSFSFSFSSLRTRRFRLSPNARPRLTLERTNDAPLVPGSSLFRLSHFERWLHYFTLTELYISSPSPLPCYFALIVRCSSAGRLSYLHAPLASPRAHLQVRHGREDVSDARHPVRPITATIATYHHYRLPWQTTSSTTSHQYKACAPTHPTHPLRLGYTTCSPSHLAHWPL